MTRLDLFLRNTGLIKQRSQAKKACDEGRVRLDGSVAKASQSVYPGVRLCLELDHRVVELEVVAVPVRPAARADRQKYYSVISDEPFSASQDLEF